jgi:hypothetical protein
MVQNNTIRMSKTNYAFKVMKVKEEVYNSRSEIYYKILEVYYIKKHKRIFKINEIININFLAGNDDKNIINEFVYSCNLFNCDSVGIFDISSVTLIFDEFYNKDLNKVYNNLQEMNNDLYFILKYCKNVSDAERIENVIEHIETAMKQFEDLI